VWRRFFEKKTPYVPKAKKAAFGLVAISNEPLAIGF
jgi:hypothetical protein